MPGPINNTLATQIEPAEPVVTYVGVPVVTVNVATCATHIPTNFKTFIGPGLGGNMLDQGTVSLGDQMGLGVASGLNSGPDTSVLGSTALFVGPAPATSLVTPHLQDMTNGLGLTAIPGQFQTMVLR